MTKALKMDKDVAVEVLSQVCVWGVCVWWWGGGYVFLGSCSSCDQV